MQHCNCCFQVAQLGMSERVGNLSFDLPQSGEMVMTKPYSENTAQVIDEEVRAMIKTAYDHTYKLLNSHKDDIIKVYSLFSFITTDN